MKNKYILLVAVSLVCYLASAALDRVDSKQVTKQLKLELMSSKETYLLGEPVSLLIDLNNLDQEKGVLLNTFDPVYGSLKIYAHNDGKNVDYEYINPKWGILETNGLIGIGPNEKLSRSKLLLSRLKSDNTPEYFFQRAGTYSVKVSYQIQYAGQKTPITLESAPITITITEPVGDDLEVWNEMKANGEFAYFIEEGDFHIPSYKTEERAKFQQEIEGILSKYPKSFYTESLRQNLN